MAQRDRGAPARAAGRPTRGQAGRRETVDRSPTVDLRALRAQLEQLIDPVVTGVDLDLDGLSVSRAGRRLVVRVTVDGDAGVGHDELTEASREISAALDEAEERGGDLTPGAYVLEVSSPGVDRPLNLPRHWQRNIGRLVTVRAGERTITKRITGADAEGVTFEEVGLVPFADLGPGRIQVEFTHLAELADEDFGEDFTDGESAIDGAGSSEEDES